MTLEDERKLVEQAKSDPEAFGRLYDDNYSKIYGYILKRVASVDIAQDITAETFIKALKNIGKFKWQNISFSYWLYRISANEIATFYRKKKVTVSLDFITEPNSGSDILNDIVVAQKELENHRDFMEIKKQITKLSIKYQEVIALRFFENMAINEIGKVLNKKEGTIKSLLHRGLEQLRKLMPPNAD